MGKTKLQEERQEFRKGRRCTNTILTIIQLKEKQLEYNRSPYYRRVTVLKKIFKEYNVIEELR